MDQDQDMKDSMMAALENVIDPELGSRHCQFRFSI